jgi:hypothetical protein
MGACCLTAFCSPRIQGPKILYLPNKSTMSAVEPEDMPVPYVRKALGEMRIAWNDNSPNSVFYPSQPLSNGMPMETFALAQVCGSHKKRHSKGKTVSK